MTFLEILYLAGCLLLIALLSLLLVALVIVRKLKGQVGKLFSEDIETLEKKARAYAIRYPDESETEILKRVIRGEALISGMIGFFTGLGGLLTLPIALPLDIFATIRIQYRLVEFLLSKQSSEASMLDTEKMKAYAIVFGSSKLSEMGAKAVIGTMVKYSPQILLKGLPIIGGITGFLLDYFSTRTVGKVALHQATVRSTKKNTEAEKLESTHKGA